MFACRSNTGASWKAVFLWALLLWVLALAVRLPGTGRDAPQTDELSWVRRSGRIISLIKAGNFSEATSFLWHPGIVPALVMATGQVSVKLIKRAIRPEAGADVQIDALRVSRISCALVSSLAPAILFLLLNLAVGWQAAIIGGMLAALDVQQVAYGRIAHLDGVFSVLVLLTIFTYWYAVERNSLSAKVGAGIFWGLALATRTFAVVLIPIFFIYKLLRVMLLPAQGDRGDRSLLSISDIWTVLIGQTLMTSIFTRMRHYPSDYKLYLWEENSAADWIYAAGSALQGHAWLVFCFVLSGLGLLWLRSRRVEQGTPSRERRMEAFWWGLAAGYIVLTLTAFPAQYDNLVRYYSRMVGLAGTTHKAFGKIWPAPPWGYWDMLVSRTTTLTLIAFFIGIVAIALTARKLIRSEVGRRQLSFLLLALVAVFFWPTVLSFTRKHAFRYLFPVMTMFLGVGAYGITWGLQHLCRVPEAHHVPARAFFLGLLVICALQGQVLLAFAPDFLIYCNAPSGGLKGNISRGHRPMLAGFNETLGALQERTADWPVVETALMADKTTVMTAYRRLFPKNIERRYFEHFPNPENADFVFVVRSQISEKTLSALSNTARYKEVFNYVSHGVPLTSLYQVLPQSYREAERRFLSKARAHTGSAVRTDELLLPEDAAALGAQPVLYARPGRHKAGYLFFGEKPYFEAGRYRLTLSLTLPLNARSRFASESSPLLRVELVHGCVEEIVSEGLVPGRLSDHLMECDVASTQKREFRGFWYGVAPIVVSSLTIERVSD